MSDKVTPDGHTTGVPDAQAEQVSSPAHKSFIGDLFVRMSITQMTLALLVAIFVWQWLDGHREISDMRRELAEKIAEMDGSSKANAILIAENQAEVRSLSAKLLKLESYYDEMQNQRTALETLYNNLSISRDETALADVEQLLLIAGQQLELLGNVKAALIAMESADARLQRMDRPAFNGLRLSIGQDIDKLRALPKVDIPGIDMQINRLLAAMDDLPLIDHQRQVRKETAQATTPSAEESSWNKALHAVWREVRLLVRVEDTGLRQIPLLPPKEEFFLRENMKMRLMLARLAMMSHDETSYRQEIKTAQLWTRRFFDAKSPEGQRMLQELDKLASASIRIDLPDISPSLQAVRTYRLSHESSPDVNSGHHKAVR
ncbi:MAG: uroporphyrinogen-III C-methyltransferase [Gallionella sp.]|nr:uroporphyrinogen-III C-methyltransferase [Gallionella sp.]MDD4945564.1 uroporphyrinogen-III C-methyltransferase [Gallionella sp.]